MKPYCMILILMLSDSVDNNNPKQLQFLNECSANNPAFPFYNVFRNFKDFRARKGCHKSELTIASCQHPELKELVSDIGGFNFNTVKARKQKEIVLPPFIPQIGVEYIKKIIIPVKAISIADLYQPLHRVGGKLIPVIVKKINLSPMEDQTILLNFYFDTFIEELWRIRTEDNYYQHINSFNFNLVTPFDFSLYWEHCIVSQLFSAKKTLKNFQELQENNIQAIVQVFAWNHDILKLWIKWINNNIHIKIVCMYLSTLSNKTHWQKTLNDIKILVNGLNRKVHFIFVGVCKFNRIIELSKIVKNFTIINNFAQKMAEFKMLISVYNNKYAPQYSTDVLLAKNIKVYEKFINNLINNKNYVKTNKNRANKT